MLFFNSMFSLLFLRFKVKDVSGADFLLTKPMFWEGGANDDLLALSVILKLAKVGWWVSRIELAEPLLVFRESEGTISWKVSCIKAALDLLLWSWVVRMVLTLPVIALSLIAVETREDKEELQKSLDMQSTNSSKDYTMITTTGLSPSFAITAVWLLQLRMLCWLLTPVLGPKGAS